LLNFELILTYNKGSRRQLKKYLFLVTAANLNGGGREEPVRHNFQRDSPKNYPCQVCFNLVQQFQKRRFKCESLCHMDDDGRQDMSIAHMAFELTIKIQILPIKHCRNRFYTFYPINFFRCVNFR